jgi:hypothetical protein
VVEGHGTRSIADVSAGLKGGHWAAGALGSAAQALHEKAESLPHGLRFDSTLIG